MKIATGMASLAVLIMAFGVGWLLDTLEVVEPVTWIWVALMAVSGALVMVLGGWNKLTAVGGPGLMACAAVLVLYQLDRLSAQLVGPVLVIAIGALLLLSAVLPVPWPPWMREDDRQEAGPP